MGEARVDAAAMGRAGLAVAVTAPVFVLLPTLSAGVAGPVRPAVLRSQGT
jgi:hypothetical protein